MDMRQIVRYEAEFDLARARKEDFEDLTKCLKDKMKIVNIQVSGSIITFLLEEEKKSVITGNGKCFAPKYQANKNNMALSLRDLIKEHI